MKYNKLVRDKIPEYIRKKGGSPKIHTASQKEYGLKLKEKLKEELKEFEESESIEEIADIEEVIEAIVRFKKFSKKKIISIKNNKRKERGGFKKKIILEES